MHVIRTEKDPFTARLVPEEEAFDESAFDEEFDDDELGDLPADETFDDDPPLVDPEGALPGDDELAGAEDLVGSLGSLDSLDSFDEDDDEDEGEQTGRFHI